MPGLNGHQFIPITQLMGMKANDFADDQYSHSANVDRSTLGMRGPEASNITVGQLSRNHPYYKSMDDIGHGYDFDKLSRDVGEHGLTSPLHVASADFTHGPNGLVPNPDTSLRLRNGHHRAIMAMEQGHMFVPVTDKSAGQEGWSSYRDKRSSPPNRTWEPLIQQHEDESWASRPHRPQPQQTPGQGQLFQDPGFTDKRSRRNGP